MSESRADTIPAEGRRRVVIEDVTPRVDGGRFPAKRTEGEAVRVEADVFAEGHDAVACSLLHRPPGEEGWRESRMEALGNDRWAGELEADRIGLHAFAVVGWVDAFETWRGDLEKRVAAEQDVAVDLRIGAGLVREAAGRAAGEDAGHAAAEDAGHVAGEDADALADAADALADDARDQEDRVERALHPALRALVRRWPDRAHATRTDTLELRVDRERARFSAWYELFPRSAGPAGEHGTLADAEAMLPYVARMGFDIVYLPPIHPIGRTHRKGPNNATVAREGDVGSPWAIGAAEGGHDAIHPELGAEEDFARFVARAEELGLEVALDIAFQAAPDHPWVEEHPEWFRHRPDGTIQYAENPPKKYQDIYPFDFESEAWPELWEALRGVFEHWIDRGVRIFRVDNPHTKPFPFWEWVIGTLQAEHPDLIFLSEAFTRPKVMYRLAKLGFTQSYTYFAWRNAKWELQEYLTELVYGPPRDFFRPSFWPNTPDILTEFLQTGGRGAFLSRVTLAATLTASYGIYGPAFELQESEPREPGSEEYLDSEKYQIRDWDLERPDSLRDYVARLNRIRRENPALQRDGTLRFHGTDNDEIIAYSKLGPGDGAPILTVVSLDPHHVQSGWVEVDPERFGIAPEESYLAHDLITDARYTWTGGRGYVELDPDGAPAHVLRIERRLRSERDFDYYA